jgi:hypothetical protein
MRNAELGTGNWEHSNAEIGNPNARTWNVITQSLEDEGQGAITRTRLLDAHSIESGRARGIRVDQ